MDAVFGNNNPVFDGITFYNMIPLEVGCFQFLLPALIGNDFASYAVPSLRFFTPIQNLPFNLVRRWYSISRYSESKGFSWQEQDRTRNHFSKKMLPKAVLLYFA